jgi:hypothetical protein
MKRLILLSFICSFFYVELHAIENPVMRQWQFSFAARGGISPIFFSNSWWQKNRSSNFDQEVRTVLFNKPNNAVLTNKLRRIKTNDMSNIPVNGSIEGGVAIFDDFELFLNFDYTYGGGKSVTLLDTSLGGARHLVKAKFEDLKNYGGYIGLRQYYRLIDKLSIFLGAKIGGLYRDAVGAKYTYNGQATKVSYLRHSIAFSGGPHVGLNYNFYNFLSVYGQIEIIGSTGTRGMESLGRIDQGNQFYVGIAANKPGKRTVAIPVNLGVKVIV